MYPTSLPSLPSAPGSVSPTANRTPGRVSPTHSSSMLHSQHSHPPDIPPTPGTCTPSRNAPLPQLPSDVESHQIIHDRLVAHAAQQQAEEKQQHERQRSSHQQPQPPQHQDLQTRAREIERERVALEPTLLQMMEQFEHLGHAPSSSAASITSPGAPTSGAQHAHPSPGAQPGAVAGMDGSTSTPGKPPARQSATAALNSELRPLGSPGAPAAPAAAAGDFASDESMQRMLQDLGVDDQMTFRTAYRTATSAMGIQAISLADQSDLLHLPARDALTTQRAMAGTGSTSSIISSLSLRVAQLESTLAARDTEIHYLRRQGKSAKTAPPGLASPGAHPAQPLGASSAAAAAAVPVVAEDDVDEELRLLEDSVSGLAARSSEMGPDQPASLKKGSLGATLLAQVSPATLTSQASTAEGVLALKQHHSLLIQLTVKFDVALGAAVKEAELLKKHVDKLELELRNATLHADTLAIEAENLQSRDAQLQQVILDLRRAGAEGDAALQELERDYDALDAEHADLQIKCDVLEAKVTAQAAELADTAKAAHTAQTHLRAMTQRNEEETYEKNALKLKVEQLEAEFEKVERIWEEHQRTMGAWNPVTGGAGGAGASTSPSNAAYLAQLLAAQQAAGGDETTREEKTNEGGPATVGAGISSSTPPALVVGSVQTHASPPVHAWLREHELQHLFHKNEKRKLKKELRETQAQAEAWRENYETLQKLHYSMIDSMDSNGGQMTHRSRAGAKEAAAAYHMGQLPPDPVPPCPAPALPMSPAQPMTARSAAAAAQNSQQQPASGSLLPPLPSAPDQDLSAMRGEVKKLIYFLVRRGLVTSEGYKPPLLPPMPHTLPSACKDAWICLEETIHTQAAQLDASRLEASNLNSMLSLILEPAFKMDWSAAGVKRAAGEHGGTAGGQSDLVSAGLAMDLAIKEEELVRLAEVVEAAKASEKRVQAEAAAAVDKAKSDADDLVAQISVQSEKRAAEAEKHAAERVREVEAASAARLAELAEQSSSALSQARESHSKEVSDLKTVHAKAVRDMQEASERRIREAVELQRYWEDTVAARVAEVREEGLLAMRALSEAQARERQAWEEKRREITESDRAEKHAELATARQAHRQELEQLRERSSSEAADRERRFQEELSSLKAQHARTLAALQTEHDNLRAASEAAELASLSRQRPSRMVQVGPEVVDGRVTRQVRFFPAEDNEEEAAAASAQQTGEQPPRPYTSSILSLLAPGADLSAAPAPDTRVLQQYEARLEAALGEVAAGAAALAISEAAVDALKAEVASLHAQLSAAQGLASQLRDTIASREKLSSIERGEASSKEERFTAELQRWHDRFEIVSHWHSRLIGVLRAELAKSVGSNVDWRDLATWSLAHETSLASKLDAFAAPTMFVPLAPTKLTLEAFEDEASRAQLARDQATLLAQREEFRVYLEQQHSALDSRLGDIQAAEELILAKDREILVECAVLNAKIEEYNKKAAELNARTEELKKRRQEMREERAKYQHHAQQNHPTVARAATVVSAASASSSALAGNGGGATSRGPAVDVLATSREEAISSPLTPLQPMTNNAEKRNSIIAAQAVTIHTHPKQ